MFIFIIKEVREELGVTQEELSKRTGISRNYIAELENSKKVNPSFETIFKIAQALEVEIKKIYVATSDIDKLKEQLYIAIDKYGINAPETMKISQLIDKLVNLKMQNDTL